MKVHAMFGEMSDLVDRIDAARGAAKQPELQKKLEEMKKKIVATKEGGAITGEERIREHADHLYGALLSWEGSPAQYLVERTSVLQRELDDVKKEFDALGVHGGAPQARFPKTTSACIHGAWTACSGAATEIETR